VSGPGENPCLGRGPVPGDLDEAVGRDPPIAQDLAEGFPGRVIADRAHHERGAAQRPDVRRSVTRGAGEVFLLPEPQDQDRGLAADPLGMTEDEPVEDVVPRHEEPPPGEGGNELEEPLFRDRKCHRGYIMTRFSLSLCSTLRFSC
jgi:hypothetical protein